MQEIALLLAQLDEGYDRRAWHGPNLRGAIRGLSLETAAWRPGKGRHSIWELVVHCAYWKYTVRRRLTGEPRGSFPLKGSNFFTRSSVRPEAALWRSDLALLADQHRLLCAAVARFPARRLAGFPPGSKMTCRAMIFGVAAHDIYHAGQIQLLKRFRAAVTASTKRSTSAAVE